jgi:hypothetical protein
MKYGSQGDQIYILERELIGLVQELDVRDEVRKESGMILRLCDLNNLVERGVIQCNDKTMGKE